MPSGERLPLRSPEARGPPSGRHAACFLKDCSDPILGRTNRSTRKMTPTRLALLLTAFVLATPSVGRAADKAAAAPAAGARTVELTLTEAGLAPAEVTVKKGERLRLGITRKTDKTCMTEVVVSDYGIKQPLPLGKTVYVELTPTRAGRVKVLCGMGMEYGTLVVD